MSRSRTRQTRHWLGWFLGAAAWCAQGWLLRAAETTSPPLSPVPGARKAGFTQLDAAQTGIHFTNRVAAATICTNRLLEDGSGVAAGDVDGDGWCDLYFCGLDSRNALYRNLGNGRFEDTTATAGVACEGQFSTGAVLADLDGDGDLDLLVNALGKGTRCFHNRGHGRFQEATDCGLVQEFGSRSLALADVDGDGDLDLHVTNYRTTTVRDSPVTVKVKRVAGQWEVPPEHRERFTAEASDHGTVALLEWGEPDVFYLNQGRGKFEPVSWTGGRFLDETGKPLASPPRDWGLSAMFRDLNGDGAPDLYVCNDFFTPDRIWINQGKGTFRALPRLALRKTCYAAMAVDFADLNRDGYDEIFVTEMLSRDHVRRQVQHSLLEMPSVPAWGWGWAVGETEARVQVMRNTLSLNRGDGTYSEIAQFSGLQASDWTWGVAFCDVDLDGLEDVLIANGHGRDLANSDALAAMDRLPKAVEPGERLKSFHLFPPLNLPHLAFRNRGDLTFEEVSRAWGFDVVGSANGMALADLDNDGDLDVILNQLNSAAVVLRNDSVAPRIAVRLRGENGNTQGIGAKIKVTGGPVPQSQEICSGGHYLSGSDPLRVFAAGTAAALTVEVSWPGGKRSVLREALPNRIYTLAEAEAQPQAPGPAAPVSSPHFEDRSALLHHVHHEEAFDDFQRQPLLSRRLSQLGPAVAWCDLSGDGWEDLVVGSGRGGGLRVWLNTGRGGFTAVDTTAWGVSATDDLTGMVGWSSEPGNSTLLVGRANYETGDAGAPGVLRVDLFFGTAENSVAAGGSESSTGPLAVADFDADGDLDLFVGGRVVAARYPAAATSRIYRSVENKFVFDEENSGRLAGVGLVSGAVWSDLDGDGWAELVLACEWGPLRIFWNRRGVLSEGEVPLDWAGPSETPGRSPRPNRLQQLTGWWNGVTSGDFDGDGRMDLMASNWGLNNRYREALVDGLSVFHGDVDGNGDWDLVEAYWEPGMKKTVPWRDWKTLKSAIPLVGERFSSYAEYGRASVSEILGEGFRQAQERRASVLESVVLLNRGTRFEVRALPVPAQLAPAFAACVADFDGDGHEDLFLSQNFFGTDLETGRYDAGRGLWLRGNGHGDFAAVPGPESGILVYGEQRGAAVSDFDADGRVDLVVSQNAGETKLYRNVRASPGLRVQLVGPGRNGSGIGAVVRLGHDGQWGPAREVRGGSGYWSQDGAIQVLYGAESPADHIQVRWPGGRSVVAKLPSGVGQVRVHADGQVEALP